MTIRIRRKYSILLLGLLLVSSVALVLSGVLFKQVDAWYCAVNGQYCRSYASGGDYECNEGDNGAACHCCFWTNYPGTNCGSVGCGTPCLCNNEDYYCGGTSTTPTPTTCPCSPRGCNPGREPDKFMSVVVANGTSKSCNNPCNPVVRDCDPTTKNAPPSCSMVPPSITMNRNEAPRELKLTAYDADYGDEVIITKVKVVDLAGHLKSCVDVLSTGGGVLDNMTVKAGSDDSGYTSQENKLLVDSRYARGDYDIVNGQAVCSGVIKVEVRDIDLDGNGPDVSDYATCKVNITVYDDPPLLSDVSLYDRDEMATIREPDDLVDGRAKLFVGSSITTQTKTRASKCDEPLAILDPVKCPGGGEGYSETFSQRRNPLLMEFTVSDANGADDISQGGVWVQRNALNGDKATTPLISGGIRNSLSTMYPEAELSQVPNQTQMLCYSKGVADPTIVTVGTPVICPKNCAACIKKEGVQPIVGNPNALKFRFGLYFNDSESGGQGMTDESYGIYVSALDKVGIPFHNVVGKGPNGWMKFDKAGSACTGPSCPNNSDFVLLYDPVAPKVDYMSWGLVGLDGVKTTFNLSDKAGGSGVSGVTNRFMVRQETLDGEPLGDRKWAYKVPGGALYNGENDQQVNSSGAITLEGTGLVSGEEIVAGLCVYDRAGNMGCGRNREPYVFLAPWIKTSYGDIFSAKGGTIPFSQTIPTDDGSTNDSTIVVNTPFNEQVFTVGTGLLLTSGSSGQGLGLMGGHLVGGATPENRPIGFKNNYRTEAISSDFNVYGYLPFLIGNEYERLKSLSLFNCSLKNMVSNNNCQRNGSMGTLGFAQYNIITMQNGDYQNTITCTNTNVIFVDGPVAISGQVIKDALVPNSGCIFVLSRNASLTIKDLPSDSRTPGAAGQPGSPYIDQFNAAIIANEGAVIKIEKGDRGTLTKSTDRLEMKGWLYSASTVPLFKRYLAPVDNRRFPSEWIKYDATLLDLFRPILGTMKTVDLTCGTSSHILCGVEN